MKRYYRKLQKISESFFVCLPKNWIKKFDLQKNSTVAIDIRGDGSLIINPNVKDDSLDAELILPATRYVAREIVKNSLSGIERIIVISDKEIKKEIKNDMNFFINGLPNTDIIEETKQRIVIQNFGYKKIPTRKLIQRLLYLVCDMFENVRKNQQDELDRIFNQLRKFYFMLVTHIRTYLRTGIYVSEDNDFTPVEAMDYRIFCQKVEQIGEILKKLNIIGNNNVIKFFSQVESYFKETMEAFLKKDFNLAYDLWFKRDEIVDQAKDLISELDYNEVDKVKDMVMIAHSCKDMAALI